MSTWLSSMLAAAAPPLAQRGGADAALVGPDLLVERDQVLPTPARRSRPGAPTVGVALGRVVAHRARPVASTTAASRVARSPLVALEDGHVLGQASARSMISSSMSSSSDWRRDSEVSSCWSAWRSLAVPVPGVQPGLVAGGPVADLLDVGLGLVDLALHVGQGGPRVDQLGVERARLVLERGDLAVLRQVRRGVRDLVEPHVDRLEVEQRELAGRVGFQLVPPGGCQESLGGVGAHDEGPGLRAQRGDVGLQPRGPSADDLEKPPLGRRQPDVLARPVPGVDQVGPPAAGGLPLLQRRVMAQVGGDVDVDVGARTTSNRSSPDPPSTATRSTSAAGSPLTRMPPDGGRQPVGHPVGEGAQRHRRGEVPDPAERIRDVLERHDVGEPDRGASASHTPVRPRRRWCGRSRWRGRRGSPE